MRRVQLFGTLIAYQVDSPKGIDLTHTDRNQRWNCVCIIPGKHMKTMYMYKSWGFGVASRIVKVHVLSETPKMSMVRPITTPNAKLRRVSKETLFETFDEAKAYLVDEAHQEMRRRIDAKNQAESRWSEARRLTEDEIE